MELATRFLGYRPAARGWGPRKGESTMPAAPLSLAAEEDRAFCERELGSFLPDRIFDAHMPLYKQGTVSWALKGLPPQAGYPEYQALVQALHPRRRTAALFLPAFSADRKDTIPQGNEWIGQQLAQTRDCVGTFFVKPDDDPEWVRQEVRRVKLRGLEGLHTMAARTPPPEGPIPPYPPPRAV